MMDDTTTQNPLDPAAPVPTDDSTVIPAPTMDVPSAEPTLPGDMPAETPSTETPSTETPATGTPPPAVDPMVVPPVVDQPAEDSTQM